MDDNTDVPIDHKTNEAVAAAVGATSPTAERLVREHVEEHGEVLATILLDEVGLWFVAAAGRATEESGAIDDAERAVAAVARLFEDGEDHTRDIVSTGFLEAMPAPDDGERAVVERLPVALREELARMEAWKSTAG